MYGAEDRLMGLLYTDTALQPLYLTGLTRIAANRFERNLRILFKRFSADLGAEAENVQQRAVATFVRYRARNSAHIICNSFKQEISRLAASNEVAKAEMSFEEPEDASGNSSDSGDLDNGAPDVQQLQVFIVGSRAFETLKVNLRLFIYPEELKGPTAPLEVNGSSTYLPQGCLTPAGEEMATDVRMGEKGLDLEEQQATEMKADLRAREPDAEQSVDGEDDNAEDKRTEVEVFSIPQPSRTLLAVDKSTALPTTCGSGGLSPAGLCPPRATAPFEKQLEISAQVTSKWWSKFICLTASIHTTLRWEPVVPQDMKRARWKCVSGL
jgi:hypothetical protein